MAYLDQFYTDLRTVIAATWADVLPNGIWEDEHIEMVPWADLTPPFAVICIDNDPADTDGEWGATNQVYTIEPAVFYVGAITGDSAPIRAKLESLRDALLSASVSNGQIIDVSQLTWSDQLEANSIFMAKDYTHRAGRLTVNAIVGTAK